MRKKAKACGKLDWSKYAASSSGPRNRIRPKYEYEARAGALHLRVMPRSDIHVRRAYQLWVRTGKGQFKSLGDFRTPQQAKARASRWACKGK